MIKSPKYHLQYRGGMKHKGQCIVTTPTGTVVFSDCANLTHSGTVRTEYHLILQYKYSLLLGKWLNQGKWAFVVTNPCEG